VKKFDLSKVKVDRGQMLSEEEANKITDYKRHQFTESGISPRAIPLQGKALVVTDADEHDEAGHMIEDAEMRKRMMLKRLKKLASLSNRLDKPRFHVKPDAKVTLIGWGSTYGAINEAVSLLESEGITANVLQLNELWPFPVEAVTSALGDAKKSTVIENNATGQLAHLIRAESGIEVSNTILKFDGRPFSPEHIVREVKKEVE
jgi:2-oxoglutarate ferredoxin oxidoreductase subunit alpha